MTTGLVVTLTSTTKTEDSEYRVGRDTNKYCQDRTVITGLKTLPSTKKGEEWECRERNVTAGLKTLTSTTKPEDSDCRAEDTIKH